MAKITDYQSLISTIESYFKRSDAASHYDSFIALAESDIWDTLRVREMEGRATASTSTTDRFLPLPDGFIKMRRMQVTVNSQQYDLDARTPKAIKVDDCAGIPTQFAITSQIEFNRKSDQAYTVEMSYIKELSCITATNTTNDVLTSFPNIYLSGCMHYASVWAHNFSQAQYWRDAFDNEIARANRKARNGRFGPAPAVHQLGSRP